MQEKQLIQMIKTLCNANDYIGDDAAFLPDENLLVSTDALVEDVHFTYNNISPFNLGWKTAAVNISDIAAMGGKPKYFLLSASLSKKCTPEWTKQFTLGVNACCEQFKTSLVGGDLTKADKVYLCGTLIGLAVNNKVAKRSYAKIGHKIIVTGRFGESAAGLWALQNNLAQQFPEQVLAHQKPIPQVEAGFNLLQNTDSSLAMMDSSDGLLDSLKQISEQSKVKLKITFEKIPVNRLLVEAAFKNKINLADWVLAGGEDYQLVATTDQAYDSKVWTEIGEVLSGEGLEISQGDCVIDLDALKIFQHFC
jgi:thiamine-monophosphate kinase